MIKILFRKIYKNIWMFLGLLLGLIIATSLVCSIPMFTRGMLQKVIVRDLQDFKNSKHEDPGSYYLTMNITSGRKVSTVYQKYSSCIKNYMQKDMGLKVKSIKTMILSTDVDMYTADQSDLNNGSYKINAYSDVGNYINITKGKVFSQNMESDNTIDVIVPDEEMKERGFNIGDRYLVKNTLDKSSDYLKIKITGSFEEKNPNDSYWNGEDFSSGTYFITDSSIIINLISKNIKVPVSQIEWMGEFDYRQLEKIDLANITQKVDSEDKEISKNGGSVYMPVYKTIKAYNEKGSQLKNTLLLFELPVLVLIAFYIFMVSDLIIDGEKNEIAVLKSRGASRGEIFKIYASISGIFSFIGLIMGPFIALLICKFLGVCDGFLQFSNREGISTRITINEFIYALITSILFLITMLIPVIKASKNTIVILKQNKARKKGQPIWKKFYLDIVMLAIVGYGIYTYNTRRNFINLMGMSSSDMPVDPVLYIVLSLFILGTGLLFLRFYPSIVKLILKLRIKKWTPEAYASLINVERSGRREQFLMMFLIFTFAIGIFDIKFAKVVNASTEYKARYLAGADITMKSWWKYHIYNSDGDEVKSIPSSDTLSEDYKVNYEEPLYANFKSIKGAASITKVFKTEGDIHVGNKTMKDNNIMGIIPDEFGRTAWFLPSLLPVHWYNYLNAMTKNEKAAIISTSLAKKYGFKLGNTITIRWKNSPAIDLIVYGIVDYWPSYNPYANADSGLVVANLNYLNKCASVFPYEVWVKKDESSDASSKIYKSVSSTQLELQKFHDVDLDVYNAKIEPSLQGINGALTLGFISTMAITTLGFVIFCVISIKNRVLQFGIFRSMGMSLKSIIRLLIYEQIMISGVGILMGIIIGNVSSSIFVPFLRIASDEKKDIIPISAISLSADYGKFIFASSLMLIIGIAAIISYVSRIKMAQAVKLGED